jgi:hypothetical protein
MLSTLVGLNKVTLVWVLGRSGILGNEESDRLARRASAMPLPGPELALGIPRCLAREVIRTWTMNQHYFAWRGLPRYRHGKIFIHRPCKKSATELLRLSRHQFKMVVVILTGRASVRTPLYHGPV